MITPDGIELRAGGRSPRRGVDYGDPLEAAVYFQLGPLMVGRDGYAFCVEVWEALTNVVWTSDARHGNVRVLHSFRSAGDVIAAILDDGDYNDWYCCGSPGVVSDRIARLMRKSGWTWERHVPPIHKMP